MSERKRPAPQELFRHFKGKLYQVLTLAVHSETGEDMVVYQALYGEYKIYCRPLDSFLSPVDKEKYPEVSQEYRFEQVRPVAVPPREVKTVGESAVREEAMAQAPQRAPVVLQSPEQGSGVMSKTIEEEAEELGMDPLVVRFLDADNASERIRVLDMLRGSATNDMIDVMAMSAGFDIDDGEPWERFNELRECLRTVERFETDRLR